MLLPSRDHYREGILPASSKIHVGIQYPIAWLPPPGGPKPKISPKPEIRRKKQLDLFKGKGKLQLTIGL